MSVVLNNIEEQIELTGKKEIKRSASYPSLTINEAFAYANKIYDKFSSVEVSREEIGLVFGLHPNTVARDIAAGVQFGFFSKTTNGKYKVSDLFNDLLHPESEKDRKLKLISAFGSPKIFQELITKFDNQVIPVELPNTLIKHHGITPAASKSAADTFIISGQQAGVINENRALKYQVTLSTISKTQYAEVTDLNIDENIVHNQNLTRIEKPDATTEIYVQDSNKKVPIYLTKEKVAYLVYPNEITASDISIIDHQLKGILLRIQLENDEKKDNTKATN